MTPRTHDGGHARRIAAITATTLALVLGASAITMAVVRDRRDAERAAPVPVATVTPTTVPNESPTREPRPTPPPTPEPTVEPSPVDPYALADGTYPAYLRKVVVEAATIRVDVIQVFLGDEARREARRDGMSWRDSRYLGLYLRNENPILRTLPVAADARIEFVGGCLAEDTLGGLRGLYRDSTPFTDAFYYDLIVEGGVVVDVTQRYVAEGC